MSEVELKARRIYTPGGPVQVGGGLYIERRSDIEILDHCRAGEYVNVLSTRQVGKSSLMYRASRELKSEGILSAIIDLGRQGAATTAEQWYLGLLTKIGKKLLADFDVLRWWQDNAHFGETERFYRFFQNILLTRINERIVIFIDEIDTTLSLKFSDDFFIAIRSMFNARAESAEFNRLSFVLIGVANPTDLIGDANRTPFNIGRSVELTDFTFEEALPLADGLGLREVESQQVLKMVLDWTGGHPFLSQSLCRAIADHGREQWTKSEVDQLVDELFLKQAEQDSNIRAVRDLLTKRAPDVSAVLTAYRDVLRGKRVPDEERSPIKSHLKLAGVVRRDERGMFISRNRVYRQVFDEQWIKEHLPVDWKKRFRYALAAMLIVLPLITVPLSIFAWNQKSEAQRLALSEREARRDAEEQRDLALKAASEADRQRDLARNAAEEADRQRDFAQKSEKRAKDRESVAVHERQRAEVALKAEKEALAEADKQKRVARSRELAAYAEIEKENDPELSFQLAARAVNTDDNEQARKPLRETLPRTFLQAELTGHTASVRSASFSADGRWIVTASLDNTARVWEAASGREVAKLTGHTDSVWSASFSADGRWIVTASRDNTAIIYPYEMFAPAEEVIALARKRVLRKFRPEEEAKYPALKEQ